MDPNQTRRGFDTPAKRGFNTLPIVPGAFGTPASLRPAHVRVHTADIYWLRDCSPSMDGAKAAAANEASAQLIRELADPSNEGGFRLCVIDFAGIAELVCHLKLAHEITGPLPLVGRPGLPGGTNFNAALNLAMDQIGSSTPRENSLRPILVLFSDGESNEGGCPLETASKLRSRADIVTVAFGEQADKEMLARIASPNMAFAASSEFQFRILTRTMTGTLRRTRATGQKLPATLPLAVAAGQRQPDRV